MRINDVLAGIAEKEANQRRDNFRRYREILSRTLDGELSEPDEKNLAKLIASLRLSVAAVQSHVDSLKRKRDAAECASQLEDARRRFEEVKSKVSAILTERDELLKSINARLDPLVATEDLTRHEVLSLETRLNSSSQNEDELFAEFYEYVPAEEKPAGPRTPQDESNRRAALHATGASICESLIAGTIQRQTIDYRGQEAIEVAIADGISVGGSPITRERLPADAQKDLRPGMCKAAAARRSKGDTSKEIEHLCEIGAKNGWINADDAKLPNRPSNVYLEKTMTSTVHIASILD
jgi:hypothetical protein